MRHHTRTDPVPVPDWTLHWPRCSCGWSGDIVRYTHLADEQINEHLEEHPDLAVQPALPGMP